MNCYLCNKELVEKNIFDNLPDTDKTTKCPDHGEHIFQQGIGGTLSPKGVLCEPCGNNLSKEIDTPFIKQFQYIISRLNFYRDRKISKLPRSPDGIMEFKGEALLVYVQGENVYPITPTDFEKDGIVYAILKEDTPNKYIESQIKPKYPNIETTDIKIIRNLKGYGTVHTEHNLNNKAFKQGFAKIATGFATYKGVNREYLNLVLDLDNYRIKEEQKLHIANYLPTTITEKCIEQFRFLTGNLESMFHQIKLVNYDQLLIAYIEIFGVYQVSLVLSDCYTGKDIYETYTQPLFKRKEDILTYIPDREDYQINYEHKLKPETKSKIQIDASGKELQDLLVLMNKDIRNDNMSEVKNMEVDEYYTILVDLYCRCYPFHTTPNIPNLDKEYVSVIKKELENLSSEEIFEQMLITRKHLQNPRDFKILTWDGHHMKPNLVVMQNNRDNAYNRDDLKKYLDNKFKQLSVFLELYIHELLSEGYWELYASNGLQKSSK